ncbi:hypothetical protein ACQUQU_07320 [Thalassolituus sp. LLYu03]|uniref:hypothetical protein n=1 Tax=Thalassolituus sp. LLYu03 TaxID=3421656 RepID=UPI003D29693B
MLALGNILSVCARFCRGGCLTILTLCSALAHAENTAYALHKGPGNAFPVVYEIPADTKLSVIALQSGWVLLSDGRREGWLPASSLQAGEGRTPAQIWYLNDVSRTGRWSTSFAANTLGDVGVGLEWQWTGPYSLIAEASVGGEGNATQQRLLLGASRALVSKEHFIWSAELMAGTGLQNADSSRWDDHADTSVALLTASTRFRFDLSQTLAVSAAFGAEQAIGGTDAFNPFTALSWTLAL